MTEDPRTERVGGVVSCVMGFGAIWVERLTPLAVTTAEVGDDFRYLVVRVPSNPRDVESRSRDYVMVLTEDERRALAAALLDGLRPEGTE